MECLFNFTSANPRMSVTAGVNQCLVFSCTKTGTVTNINSHVYGLKQPTHTYTYLWRRVCWLRSLRCDKCLLRDGPSFRPGRRQQHQTRTLHLSWHRPVYACLFGFPREHFLHRKSRGIDDIMMIMPNSDNQCATRTANSCAMNCTMAA